MRRIVTRRIFLQGTAFGTVVAGVGVSAAPAWGAEAPAPVGGAGIGPEWPTQAPALVREMVGVSHGNVARVRELLAKWPTLARAAWDWGFGDWEDALGAASHVGNREIAELLIAHGARPTLFSAAMLGQLAVVQAFVDASPGIQKTPGPHGITLLDHARAGGERAAAVLAYLEKVGDAGQRPATTALSEAEQQVLVGTYVFGAGVADRIVVAVNRFGLAMERAGTAQRNLAHLGKFEFFPVGVPAARVRFLQEGGKVIALEVHDPDLVCRATREG
jgi:hypothetical protein